ncbi:MAG: tetratricopeptide repeat protein [Chloroflexota bacterium]
MSENAATLDDLNSGQRSAFARARLLVVEGDFARAADEWAAIRGATLPAAAASEARFELALSLARSSRGAAALQVLDGSLAEADSREPFVRGLALDAANRHAQGMQSLAEYATANPVAAAAAWLELAERELSAGLPREAADAAAKGLETAQARPLKQRLLEVRAQALADLGDNDAAFDAHRQVLALATTGSTLGEQLFHLAQVSRDLGKPDAAVQALKTALDQFPQASTTGDALRLLDELGAASDVDSFVLGRARYLTLDYRNAVNAFGHYLEVDPTGPDVPSARLYAALASLTPGNEPNALRQLDAIADDPDQQSEIAAQALVEAGQALEGLSEPDQAEARYQKLLVKFPHLDVAATAGFRLGLVRYVRGADMEAISAWDGLLARRDDIGADDVARALYWRAKAFGRLGRMTDAHASFKQAAAVQPSSYYTLRAALQIGQLSNPGRDSQLPGPQEEQLAAWLASHHQDLTAARTTVANDPALVAAQADAELGLFRQGNWQADELLQRYPDRADSLYVLARRFAELGLDGGATRLGQAAYKAASIQSPDAAPAALLEIAFPRPYSNLTDTAAERYGVDPLLLESTFRDGSQFDAWADDAATGARGLAHMSPVHTDEVRSALGLQANADDGLGVTAGVEQQAWLLADRLRRFDGRPEVALSAIDTTERLVDSWLVRPGAEDVDAYIELVDYEDVRAALRGVLATRLSYAIAYPSPTSADPITAMRVKPEPTPAWIKIARLAGDVPAAAPLSAAASVGTPDEQAAFAHGAGLQRDGDYTAATRIFEDLAASSTPAVATAARLRLGQSLVGAERPAEAIAPLQLVEAAQPPGSEATFLLGRSLADAGRCQDAVASYAQFARTNPGPLAAQAQIAEANCLTDLGRPADAVSVLEHTVGVSDVARLQSLDFHERLALARVRAGDREGARAEYASLLSQARTSSYRAELSYYLGLLAPDASSAAGQFRSSIQLDPRGRPARAALDELVALEDGFASSVEAGDTRFEQNRYREALAAYTTFVQQNPADPHAPRAYYGRGVALVRLGQERAGIAVLESLAERFPNSPESADGLFRAGRILESLVDLDGAAQDYQRVMAQPGAGARAADARFRLAFIQFQHANFDLASAGWRDLASRATAAEAQAQAFFWLGKALHAAGDEGGARTAWTSARDADPRGFYGWRAADLLAGQTNPLAQVDQTLPFVQARAGDDPMASVEAWLASLGDVSAAQQRLSDDSGLTRAEVLLSIGLRQAAVWELDGVESRLSTISPGSVALLGAWEQQRGLYHAALRLGFDLAGMANVSLTSGPFALRRLVYPLPNPALLVRAARQLHVDPLLYSSLLLQESNMDQAAESAAQARGLSQLVASTGYDAARAMGQYRFISSDLFRPSTSISLGAFTFGQRLARYDGRIFPALAAYNASQVAVDGWLLAATTDDVDTFAEAIPFTETYPYVQRIYENYKQYLELYGTQSDP